MDVIITLEPPLLFFVFKTKPLQCITLLL